MKKTILIACLSIVLFSCGSKVTLQGNYVVVDSVKSLTDSTYEVRLKCQNNPAECEVNFVTSYRYQAGDTMWTEIQLKTHYNKMTNELSTENQRIKDSLLFYKENINHKTKDYIHNISLLEAQNNALQKVLVKSKQ